MSHPNGSQLSSDLHRVSHIQDIPSVQLLPTALQPATNDSNILPIPDETPVQLNTDRSAQYLRRKLKQRKRKNPYLPSPDDTTSGKRKSITIL